jgi:hypothetical protein
MDHSVLLHCFCSCSLDTALLQYIQYNTIPVPLAQNYFWLSYITCKSLQAQFCKVKSRHMVEGRWLSRLTCTANEGPVKIQYTCLVSIYVFPEMKLLFPKQNYNVLFPNSYTDISVRDLYISRIGLPILLQGNMWINPGNI